MRKIEGFSIIKEEFLIFYFGEENQGVSAG